MNDPWNETCSFSELVSFAFKPNGHDMTFHNVLSSDCTLGVGNEQQVRVLWVINTYCIPPLHMTLL